MLRKKTHLTSDVYLCVQAESDWPSVEEVHAYRIKVYAIVKDIILNHPSLVIVQISFIGFVCVVCVFVRLCVCVCVCVCCVRACLCLLVCLFQQQLH